jgi:hypothetical protein
MAQKLNHCAQPLLTEINHSPIDPMKMVAAALLLATNGFT